MVEVQNLIRNFSAKFFELLRWYIIFLIFPILNYNLNNRKSCTRLTGSYNYTFQYIITSEFEHNRLLGKIFFSG